MNPYSTIPYSSHAIRSTHAIQEHAKAVISEKKQEFPSDDWAADTLLNLFIDRGILSAQGRVLSDTFQIHKELADELKIIVDQLRSPELCDESAGISIQNDFFSLSIIELIYGIHWRLVTTYKPSKSPEIVGGGVPHLLTKAFYIAYLCNRLRIKHSIAAHLVSSFINTLGSKPNDYDYRQWVDEGEPYCASKEEFKKYFAKIFQELIQEKHRRTLDIGTIIQSGFHKLHLVESDQLRFGIGALGSYQGSPVECIVMERTDRPYLFTRDRIAIGLKMQLGDFHQLILEPQLNFYDLPEGEKIPDETALIHQLCMILDTPSFQGIDFHGWLIAITLISKGWRTLRADFFPSLWEAFAKKNCDQNRIVHHMLKMEIAWVENNHLAKPDRKDLCFAQKFALRLNLCIYLIDGDHLTPDTLQDLIDEMHLFLGTGSTFAYQLIRQLLALMESPGMSVKASLAWFRIALWIYGRKNGFREDMLSTNFGKPCLRLVNHYSEQSVIWIPLHLEQSIQLIRETIPTHDAMDSIIKSFDAILSISPVVVKQANQAFSPTEEGFLRMLKSSQDPFLLKIALHIEPTLPTEWVLLLPCLLKKFPNEQTHFRSLIGNVPRATILSPAKWALHLLETHPSLGTRAAKDLQGEGQELFMKLLNELEPVRYLSLYQKLRDVNDLFDKTQLNEILYPFFKEILPGSSAGLTPQEGGRFVPWILFNLILIRSMGKFSVEGSSRKGGIYLIHHDPDLKIPIHIAIIIEQVLLLFKESERDKTLCLEIFEYFHRSIDVPRISPESFLENFNEFIKFLETAPLQSTNFALSIKLALQKTSLITPVHWLANLPAIHAHHPDLRKMLQRHFQLTDKKPYADLLEQDCIDPIDWALALFESKGDNDLIAAGKIWRGLNENQESILWDKLTTFFLKRPARVPRYLRIYGRIDFNIPQKKNFLIQWIRSANAEKKTRNVCADYVQKVFADTFTRQSDESIEQFLERVIHQLTDQEPLLINQEPEQTAELSNRVHNNPFHSVLEHQEPISFLNAFTSVYELYLVTFPAFNFLYSHQWGVIHPLYMYCIESVSTYQYLLDRNHGSPKDILCKSSVFPDYRAALCGITLINCIALELLNYWGCINYLEPAKTLDAPQISDQRRAFTVQNPSLSKVLKVALKRLKSLAPLGYFLALFATVCYVNDAASSEDGLLLKKHCFKALEKYLSKELSQIANVSRAEILHQAQEEICLYESDPDFKNFHLLFAMLNAYLVGVVTQKLSPLSPLQILCRISKKVDRAIKHLFSKPASSPYFITSKKRRTLASISSIAFGMFQIGLSLHSQYVNSYYAYDHCTKVVNFSNPLLGKSVNRNFCPKQDANHLAYFLITSLFLQMLSAVVMYEFGRNQYRISSILRLDSATKWLAPRFKRYFPQAVSIFLTYGVISIIFNLWTKSSFAFGPAQFRAECSQRVVKEYKTKIGEDPYPDGLRNEILGGAKYMICQLNNWEGHHMEFIWLGLFHLFIAGLLDSLPDEAPLS